MNSIGWLDICGRKMGIPYREYSCMPIGQLSDLYDFFLATEGIVDLYEKTDFEYFPDAR